ncbi:MAG: hypothetical protein A2Z16_06930 [Chloroflexi bacterium RBG_16_54_18]|nr:MAG: hypothetical protein A2Z16_06930 [Chloroflexi bacterium RBG_16_54_18]
MSKLEIGRLLRADTSGFVVGCRAAQSTSPSFGSLVSVPQEGDFAIYGLVHDIRIDDDGLVRQLATAEGVEESVIADNRINRNVPLEISVIAVGYLKEGRIYHLLPPRPPLSLDVIYLCEPEELRLFTGSGSFGYFRHILRQEELPTGELLAAHIRQANEAHAAAENDIWAKAAIREIITQLRDDYPSLMTVLRAIGEIYDL